jgi:ketosteroid isomerase-like protein
MFVQGCGSIGPRHGAEQKISDASRRHRLPIAFAKNLPKTQRLGSFSDMTLPPIVQAYLDAYNRKDVSALVDCISDGVVFENVTNTGQTMRVEGKEAFAELAAQAVTMFASRKITARTAVIDGDTVALEVDWVGTPTVDLGLMKAGVEVAMRGASFITIADGKLIRIVDLS